MVESFPTGMLSQAGDICDVNKYHVDLMLKVKAGDVKSYEMLVSIYQTKLVGTIANMLGCQHEAEDLAQRTFIQVWKSAPRYEPKATFQTWLFTIAKNLVINEARRRKRKPAISLNEREDDFHIINVKSRMISPSESILLIELENVIIRAMHELPEKQRIAVMARQSEDMPYNEIAKLLDTTSSSVRSLLFRARIHLKERMAEYMETPA